MRALSEKPSLLLIPLIAAATLAVAVGTVMAATAMVRTSKDAELVNTAGMVRGGIQRAVKMELAGAPGDEAFKIVLGKLAILMDSGSENLRRSGEDLRASVADLQDLALAHRTQASAQSKLALLTRSEEVWYKSEKFVQLATDDAGDKRILFAWGLVCMLGGVILTALSVLVSKRLVADRVEVEAAYDAMTGALRRDRYLERLSRAIIARPPNHSVGVVMLDLDRFKGINDSFGHDAGDKVLAAVSGALRSLLREGDDFGRLGGEEFAVTIKSKDPRASRLFAERARAAVESLRLERLPIITISAGSAIVRPNEHGIDALKRADSYLYAAKAAGRNRVRGD